MLLEQYHLCFRVKKTIITAITMVLKIGTVKELENEQIIGFMVGSGFDRWSNR